MCTDVLSCFGGSSGEVSHPCFRDSLTGDRAFYNQPNYLDATRVDFTRTEPLPVTYTWNTTNKILRISELIFSIIIFPIEVYKLLHSLAGKIALVPASTPSLMGYTNDHANESRSNISLRHGWKYKRITIEVDGYKVDAMIVGKPSTFHNGRWVLPSLGNGEFYEDALSDDSSVKSLLRSVAGNALVFNYPGVGASSGLPSRDAMTKAYRAMLSFLEDQEKGIGAKEIIGYGHSLGGGVQGDALLTHVLKKDIRYVFVKSRTFSDLYTEASLVTNKVLGFLVKFFGWNMNSVASSKQLKAPEIIMQTARVKEDCEIMDSSLIRNDGVIRANASLAKALLEDKGCSKENKVFIGMRERHCDPIRNPSFLAQKIQMLLQRPGSAM